MFTLTVNNVLTEGTNTFSKIFEILGFLLFLYLLQITQ